MNDALHKRLQKRLEEGTIRSLSSFDSLIDFWSNDYLSIAREGFAPKPDYRSGSGGSRLIAGNSLEAVECEAFLAHFFQSEAALVFNSGYDANLGFFSSVPQRDDLVLYDEHIHASVRDGIRLGLAKSHGFEHNSVEDLKRKLERKGNQNCYVAVESLYSMDGDMAPLLAMIELCEHYGAWIIVDEAHAAGVFGEQGQGIVSALGLQDRVFARLVTFGKAYGSHGAAILGSEMLKNYLINFARSFIYTTALPPHYYSNISETVQSVGRSGRQQELQQLIRAFRTELDKRSVFSKSEINSPIQIIAMPGDEAKKKAALLIEKGYAVKAILAPTVASGNECLRICIHTHNTPEELKGLVAELSVH